MTDYFFVDGNEPSGLPGAYVVTEAEATGSPAAQQKLAMEIELEEAKNKPKSSGDEE